MPKVFSTIMLMAILLGTIFGILGGIMAYLIIYTEYRKHFTASGPAVKEGLRAGMITFIILVISALIVGWVVNFLI